MIYLEVICDEKSPYGIQRQKNKPNSEWYSIALIREDNSWLADNENWIKAIPNTPVDNIIKVVSETKLSKADVLRLRKLVKKAIKHGWFDAV